jgi:hypothetical protein
MSAGNLAVDSNVTGLFFAEEVLGSPKALSSPIWYPVEPNSYGEFGAQTKTVKREPITASRQKRKGAVVGLDVAAGFNLDFTSKVPYIMMQGFMFADWRAKDNMAPTAVSGTQYTVASGGAAFLANDLLFAENFNVAGNNGLKVPTASTATTVSAPGLAVEASPPSTARITRVGRFLRKTSLDEIPQFWNVLVGDMSLIGTRPPTPDEVERYAVPNWQRLDVRPGLSGEWQVNGRSQVMDFEDVIRLDLRYQENWSLGYDLKLIVRTFTVIFSKGSGAA